MFSEFGPGFPHVDKISRARITSLKPACSSDPRVRFAYPRYRLHLGGHTAKKLAQRAVSHRASGQPGQIQ